ncbi:MAG: DISARM system phospholipase D-like protein DrmC [Lautropia sp.]|nr:DISARM system phospholipase D-like protein DrmC [Lautropia sp.]
MDKLLNAIAAVVSLIPPEKVQVVSNWIRRTDRSRVSGSLSGVLSTPAATTVVEQLVDAWQTTDVKSEELASMLLAASHVMTKSASQQSTELVWTGPTTPFVAARRTEQALLQVVNAAEQTLFITSFVAYDISTIVNALSVASDRGVLISILLESSKDQGGTITFDAIGKMRTLVPSSRLYAWIDKTAPFSEGRVHAKVAVADAKVCFITSANLTGHAMEKNMEAGVLISGGHIPRLLDEHLRALVDTKLVTPV